MIPISASCPSTNPAVEPAIASADMVFIAVNTPTKSHGLGAGQASDLRWIEACARTVAAHATGHTVVVEKSTLPVRTAETVKAILSAAQSQPGDGGSPSFAAQDWAELASEMRQTAWLLDARRTAAAAA